MASNDTSTPRLTEETVECPLCGGSGWKMVEVVDQFGRNSQKAVRCDCAKIARAHRLLANSRIPARYSQCDFEGFTHDGPYRNLALPYTMAKKFAEEYPYKDNPGLLFTGPAGVGKTHLAVSIIKYLILQRGLTCLFFDYRELLKEIQNSYNASSQVTELGVLKPVFEADVLVLDELGAVKPTEWVWDAVSHILNSRYNSQKTTVITTNFTDKAAAGVDDDLDRPDIDRPLRYNPAKRANREDTLGDRIGERMRSRLHEMCKVIDVQGKDFRMNVKSANFQ